MRRATLLAGWVLAILALDGCAERHSVPTRIVAVPYRPQAATESVQVASVPAPPSTLAADLYASPASEDGGTEPFAPPASIALNPPVAPRKASSSLRELCKQPTGGDVIDESRRVLAETFCRATLWFDSLFAGVPDTPPPQPVSGRVELAALHSDYDGMIFRGRVRLNYDLPNLQRRVRLFLGREDDAGGTPDPRESFAARAEQFGLAGGEDWLAGFGYSPPGKLGHHVDFQVGARLKSAPEVFAQARYRRNLFIGDHSVWRLREAWFWENRDKFGATTRADFEHVLRSDLLLRWWNIGTVSQATKGLEWYDSLLFYYNLQEGRVLANEIFLHGETDADVPLREYGMRSIFKQQIGSRPYLYGDLILGYSFPREKLDEQRQGSALIGVGIELQFGDLPY